MPLTFGIFEISIYQPFAEKDVERLMMASLEKERIDHEEKGKISFGTQFGRIRAMAICGFL
ncbi:hypothetical protein GCM10023231_01250 [Olivibacter ginsenosidimutans]|uniref:Uncharacterized protein n=1 Tax=Olivibacter ginsenosidimutans TaxID=1176537 RepID=A0ABP9ACC5_9SPHI